MNSIEGLPVWATVLISVGVPVIGFLLTQFGRLMGKWMDNAAEKSKFAMLANVDEFIMGWVMRIYQEEVKHLKEASADGKLTDAEKKRFVKIIVNETLATFGPGNLMKLFGKNTEGALVSRIEKAVVESKVVISASNPPPSL